MPNPTLTLQASALSGTQVFSLDWINDGSDNCYLAVGHGSSVSVYKFDSVATTLTLQGTPQSYGDLVNSVAWVEKNLSFYSDVIYS